MIFVLVLSLTARYILSRRERKLRSVSSAFTRLPPNRHGGSAHFADEPGDTCAQSPPAFETVKGESHK